MAFKTAVQEPPEPSGKAPVHQISLPAGKGAQIQASIWENEVTSGETSFTSYSVTFARRYRDGEEWKSSYGFRTSDLLLLAKAAEMAFEDIMEEKNG